MWFFNKPKHVASYIHVALRLINSLYTLDVNETIVGRYVVSHKNIGYKLTQQDALLEDAENTLT